ncbi:MAG TPA: hypothetical protein V6D29_21790 [Leptolyngbyaceae cyanobacterium]
MRAYWPLRVVEILVLGGIVAALVLPLFTSGQEEESRQFLVEQLG